MKILFANKNFKFCFLLFIIFEIIWLITTRLFFDTDLLSLIQNKTSPSYEITKKLSEKYSNKISILVVGHNKKDTVKTLLNLKKEIPKNIFKIENDNLNFDTTSFLSIFSKYSGKLLSKEDKNNLENKDFTKIYQNFLFESLSSFTPRLFPFNKDPFLFLQHFLLNLPRENNNWKIENGFLLKQENTKNYALFFVSLNSSQNFSDKKTYDALFSLKSLKNKFKTSNVKIYINGAPFYTALTTQNSKKEINILSIVSSLVLLFVGYLLFRNFKFLIPLSLSIGLGFLTGIFSLFLFFDSIHILTLIFGTTLIGLSVDYSLHFMIAKNNFNSGKEALNHIFKNLTFSLLTTVITFFPLLFSNFSLLKQIALFSIVGLVFVYLFVSTFYIPLTLSWKKQISKERKNISHPLIILKNHKIKRLLIALSSIFTVIFFTVGILQIKFSDDIRNFYSPPKELLEDDIFFQNATKEFGKYFLVIRGKSLEDVLQKEELFTKKYNIINFHLSSFIPSIQTQKENLFLVKEFFNQKEKNLKKDFNINVEKFYFNNEFLTLKDKKLSTLLSSFFIKDSKYFYSVIPSNKKFNLDKKDSDIFVINFQDEIMTTFKEYRNETYKLLSISFFILFIFLIFIFKRKSIHLIIPSLFSILFSLSLFGILGISVTFFHFLAFFLIAGLSLDYAIFSLNNCETFTKKAVFVSFLTSFIGFGLLAFTSFELTKNLGITISLGLLISYLTALFLNKTCDVSKK